MLLFNEKNVLSSALTPKNLCFKLAVEVKIMKITVLAIGKCKKNSPEAALIAEYVKRTSWEGVIK